MSPDKPDSRKITYELTQINKELEITTLLAKKANLSELDAIEIRAAAASMQSVYNGFEKILILVLKDQDIPIPRSQAWHSDLLQLCRDKSFISEKLESQLRDLMGFRHFVRHAYSFMLENDLIKPLLDNMKPLVEIFTAEIERTI